jgi:NAD(P)-dependent dehydrogenase (short-subunit alcohol dehydrogenase family)
MREISERLFLVTGAARGIGEAIARRLLEEGGRVIICDINEEGQATADSLKKSGGEVGNSRRLRRDQSRSRSYGRFARR